MIFFVRRWSACSPACWRWWSPWGSGASPDPATAAPDPRRPARPDRRRPAGRRQLPRLPGRRAGRAVRPRARQARLRLLVGLWACFGLTLASVWAEGFWPHALLLRSWRSQRLGPDHGHRPQPAPRRGKRPGPAGRAGVRRPRHRGDGHRPAGGIGQRPGPGLGVHLEALRRPRAGPDPHAPAAACRARPHAAPATTRLQRQERRPRPPDLGLRTGRPRLHHPGHFSQMAAARFTGNGRPICSGPASAWPRPPG